MVAHVVRYHLIFCIIYKIILSYILHLLLHPLSASSRMLISQPNHLKAAVSIAGAIMPNSPYNRESFVVMACAKFVEAFVKGNDMAQEFEKGKAAGGNYKVCGMSLKSLTPTP